MINLDDIGSRVQRGYYTSKDVSDLLSVVPLNPRSQRLFDQGIATVSDVQAVFGAAEQIYKQQFGRPTSADQVVAQIAQGAADKAVADAARAAQGAADSLAQQQAQAAWLQTAQTAQAQSVATVQTQAAVDRFNAAQKAAQDIVERRHERASLLQDQLNG